VLPAPGVEPKVVVQKLQYLILFRGIGTTLKARFAMQSALCRAKWSRTMKLRVGAIGIGGMGHGHLLAAQAHPDVQICAVCDVSQAALDAVAEPDIRTYTDWQALLDKESLDLVTVCLPHYLYAPVVTAALKRGLHVDKDKPFARDLADAKQMTLAARDHCRGCHWRIASGWHSPGALPASSFLRATTN
jgi:hypothetical protein